MPSNFTMVLLEICVSFALTIFLLCAAPVVIAYVKLNSVSHNAARVAAITQDVQSVQAEITNDLTNEHLATTWNGQTLFTITNLQTPTPGSTGYAVQTGNTTPDATVTIQYNVPLPFDRAFSLFGGPVLPITIPVTKQATYYNETQYTGVVS